MKMAQTEYGTKLQAGGVGVILSVQGKVLKHLQAKNPERVADYLAVIKKAFPDKKIRDVINTDIADRAVEYLKSEGYTYWTNAKGEPRIQKAEVAQ